MNKLNVGPVKFRLAWGGPKLMSGVIMREENFLQRANHEGPTRGEGTGLSHRVSLGSGSGPSTTRWFDPLNGIKAGDALDLPQFDQDGLRKQDRATVDGACQMD